MEIEYNSLVFYLNIHIIVRSLNLIFQCIIKRLWYRQTNRHPIFKDDCHPYEHTILILNKKKFKFIYKNPIDYFYKIFSFILTFEASTHARNIL